MNDSQKAYLRGKQYERMKKREGGQSGNRNASENDVEKIPQSFKRTSEKLAEIHKVDERTIREDEKFILMSLLGYELVEKHKRV